VVPPLSDSDWNDAFARYQRIPEYEQLNRGMTLAEFKRIFLWEYGHRLWARLVGLALALPLAWFAARRALTVPLARRLLLVLAVTGAQGALGWFMVRSGLTERTDVSQYRLAAHLGLALVIYVITVWTAADLLAQPRPDDRRDARLARAAASVTGLVFLTAIAGAFVAGLDAGRVYNTFPLMGGRVVPPGLLQLAPAWRNLFENAATAQFNHRVLAVVCLIAIATLWWWARPALAGRSRRALDLLAALAVIQITLGIATLLLVVPVTLAALHQAGAVLLLTAAALLVHVTRVTGRSRSD
jgi:cytochrome c oxidase assembly protein subunit 15